MADPSVGSARALLDLLSIAVLDLHPDGSAAFANDGWATLTGSPASAALGKGWLRAFEPEERARVSALVAVGVEERRSVVAALHARTGIGRRVLRLDGRPQLDQDGRVDRFVLSMLDVTDEHARHDRLAHAARHDPLTGLANRRAFLDLAGRRASEAVRAARNYSLLFLDVDDFKLINDSGGHDVGDEVLQVVAERLSAAARPRDVVARFGGDEFVVLLDGVGEAEQARAVAERFREAVLQPIVIGGRRWRVGVSIGVALGRDDRIDQLLGRADDALYQAKAAGKGRSVVDVDLARTSLSAPPSPEVEAPAALGEHAVHFYDRDEELVLRLEDYVLEGVALGETVIVIATPEHRRALRERLEPHGLDLWVAEGRYVEFDAAETLRRFLADGMPDPDLFQMAVGTVVRRACGEGRRMRAYGEMVALLWAEGSTAAALALEDLWNDLQRTADFPLLCAYPRADVEHHAGDGRAAVCARHSREDRSAAA